MLRGEVVQPTQTIRAGNPNDAKVGEVYRSLALAQCALLAQRIAEMPRQRLHPGAPAGWEPHPCSFVLLDFANRVDDLFAVGSSGRGSRRAQCR